MSSTRRRPKARGFTLVELLVVIAIIGILVSLLLPAVQAAREAARRAQCQNNIKNVALALLHYHEAWTIFPAGSVWKEGTLQNVSESQLRESWIITTLPYMEQQGLYDSFDLDKFISDPLISDPNIIDNADARGTEIPMLLCPSDMYNRNKMDGSTGPESAGLGDGWARGNYACNAQEFFVYNNLRDKFSTDWNNLSYRGVMAANHSIGIAEMRDGSSNTMLVGEIRAGIAPYDTRGTWAMAGACASELYAYARGDDNGPNARTGSPDDMRNCTKLQTDSGGGARLNKLGMGCYEAWNMQQTARSMHDGGVHIALADGTVHWITDYIDLNVWRRLIVSADFETIPAGSFE